MVPIGAHLANLELRLLDTLRASESARAVNCLPSRPASVLRDRHQALAENALFNLRLLQQQRVRVAQLLEQLVGT